MFVGNSQFEVNDVPLIVQSLSESAPTVCQRIQSGAVLMGGANLRDLWVDGRAVAAIQSGQWDTVVLGESLDIVMPVDDSYPNDFYVYATRFAQVAQAAGVQVVLYASASVNGPERLDQIQGMLQPQVALGAQLGVPVAAGGDAWRRLWSTRPALELFGPDDAHPNYVGSVLSSYVIYATLMQRTPVGLTANPQADCASECGTISASLAAELQQAALQSYLQYGRR